MNKKIKKTLTCELAAVVTFLNFAVISVHAEGDVAGAVESTWNSTKSQIKTVTNNVIFPVIDVILAILLFVKIGLAYLDCAPVKAIY